MRQMDYFQVPGRKREASRWMKDASPSMSPSHTYQMWRSGEL